MSETLTIEVIIGAAIGAGAVITPLVYKAIKYVIDLHICVKLTKSRLESVEGVADKSSGTHSDLYNKVNKLERNLFHLMGQLNIKPIE